MARHSWHTPRWGAPRQAGRTGPFPSRLPSLDGEAGPAEPGDLPADVEGVIDVGPAVVALSLRAAVAGHGFLPPDRPDVQDVGAIPMNDVAVHGLARASFQPARVTTV